MTGKIHICASTTKKCPGQEGEKKQKEHCHKTLNTFFTVKFVWCHVTGNVGVILQREVEQTYKINRSIPHFPK